MGRLCCCSIAPPLRCAQKMPPPSAACWHRCAANTMLLLTDSITEVTGLCEHVIVLNRGHVVSDGSLKALASTAGSNNRLKLRVLGSAANLRALFASLPGVQDVSFERTNEPGTVDVLLEIRQGMDLREEIWHLAAGAQLPILEMRQISVSLEDIFLQLTGNGEVTHDSHFQKDLRSYFHSMQSFIYLSLFAVFCGYYACKQITMPSVDGGGASSTLLSGMCSSVAFLLPLITMRSFAGERIRRTERLVLTAPIGPLSVAFGKFLACAAVAAISLLPASILPFIITCMGYLSFGEFFLVLLGCLVFFLCRCGAWGICLLHVSDANGLLFWHGRNFNRVLDGREYFAESWQLHTTRFALFLGAV